MIEIKVTSVSSLTAFERAFALPLMKIGIHLARVIAERGKRGMGPDGPMRPLGADADPSSTARFWLEPARGGTRAPAENRVASGPFAGWAVWKNYAAYVAATAGRAPRDLEETGSFWRSIRVRVTSPSRVKVAPYGAHTGPSGERISNSAVGFLASRGEQKPLLHPSRQEIAEAGRIVFAEVDGQAIEAARIAGIGHQMQRKAATVQRRASKLLGG